jgi:hypothetical protein
MFMACGPVNGLLDGDNARGVFLKSKLPVEKLGQIWYVAHLPMLNECIHLVAAGTDRDL